MKRRNPSKCNDGAFSKTGNKQGACTWHQGVKKEVTTAEYNKSESRVRYGSPKGYKGAFAPKIGKSVSKPKQQFYEIDLKSFDKQYLKMYKIETMGGFPMGAVIATALYDMAHPKYAVPRVDFTLNDLKQVVGMDYEDAKAFVVENILPQWESTYNVHQSSDWNEDQIQKIINMYFDRVEKYFDNPDIAKSAK